MKNPVKEIRSEYKLTQVALASICGVTSQVIQKVESGAFYEIPANVLKALVSLTGRSALSITDDYEEWAVGELATVKLPTKEHMHYERPDLFRLWRGLICEINDVPDTIIAFATLFKIHPYVIEKFEKGRMDKVPKQLVERVRQIERLRRERNLDYYS